jgi:hypothetical protein
VDLVGRGDESRTEQSMDRVSPRADFALRRAAELPLADHAVQLRQQLSWPTAEYTRDGNKLSDPRTTLAAEEPVESHLGPAFSTKASSGS